MDGLQSVTASAYRQKSRLPFLLCAIQRFASVLLFILTALLKPQLQMQHQKLSTSTEKTFSQDAEGFLTARWESDLFRPPSVKQVTRISQENPKQMENRMELFCDRNGGLDHHEPSRLCRFRRMARHGFLRYRNWSPNPVDRVPRKRCSKAVAAVLLARRLRDAEVARRSLRSPP